MVLGKTCRLCVACELLIAPEHEVTRLLVESGAVAGSAPPNYMVLGTVAMRVWRRGLARGLPLEGIKESMADFKQYLRVEVMPRGWYKKGPT